MKSKLQLLHWNKWRTDWPSSPRNSFPFFPRFVFFGCTVCSSYYSLFAAWGENGDSAVGRNCANCCTDWFAAVFNCPVVAFVESITEDGAWADLTMNADLFFILVVLLMFSRCVLLFCFLLKGSFFFFLFDFLFPFQATFCCEPRNVLHFYYK